MKSKPRYLIKALPSKRAFYCEPDQSILDAAMSAGVALPHSCRGGNCGSCMATILHGKFEYPRPEVPMGISPEQQQSGKALLCQIRPQSDLSFEVNVAREAGTSPVVRLPARIVTRELVAKDVCKLTLKLPRSQPLNFRPGQHIKILLDRGQSRCYSIASATDSSTELELHVRRVKHGLFSKTAFDLDSTSNLVRIEGPHGEFGLRDHGSNQLLIAGGTGFAPFKSMLTELLPMPDRGRVCLVWGVRDAQDIYEHTCLQEWQQQYDDFEVKIAVEQDSEQNPDWHVGYVHELALERIDEFSSSVVYAAGPPGMIEALRQGAEKLKYEPSKLICDVFDHAPG